MSYITASTPVTSPVPHHQNIVDVNYKTLKPHSLNKLLTSLDPIFAGGYPTALFFATREPLTGLICPEYYNDIDIYARSAEHLEELVSWLRAYANGYGYPLVETDNAISLDIRSGAPLHLQVVKKTVGTPQEILETYDFVNCAVAYEPLSKAITVHKDAIAAHISREMVFLNTHIVKHGLVDEGITDEEIIEQLLRLYKYIDRWDFTLSDSALHVLLNVWSQHKHIYLTKDTVCKINSSGATHVFTHNTTSVWALLPEMTTKELPAEITRHHLPDNFQEEYKRIEVRTQAKQEEEAAEQARQTREAPKWTLSSDTALW